MSRLLIAALGAACLSLPAAAHITLEKPSAEAGRPYKAVLRIGHGCDGSPTTGVSVQIPDGFVAVKPMPKPGWKLQTEQGAYPQPVTLHGQSLTSGVRRIVWSGGSLADAEYDEFTFVGQIAPGASGALSVPVVQTCEKGENRWVETPKAGQNAHELAFPAPVLRVAQAEPSRQSQQAPQEGPIRIEQAWSRATPGGASVGGGYLRIVNTGATPDRLLGGTADVASRIETHDMKIEDGVMKMRHMPEGIEIPAGGSIDLKPGGMHLMFMGLKQPLTMGSSIGAKLRFEKAGDVPVTFSVQGIGAMGPGAAPASGGMDHSGHMQMHGQ